MSQRRLAFLPLGREGGKEQGDIRSFFLHIIILYVAAKNPLNERQKFLAWTPRSYKGDIVYGN